MHLMHFIQHGGHRVLSQGELKQILPAYGKVPAGLMDPQTLSWPFLENTVCHGHYQCYREGRWIGSREGNILLSAWVSSKCQNSERELGK